jgi:hypothetical protein
MRTTIREQLQKIVDDCRKKCDGIIKQFTNSERTEKIINDIVKHSRGKTPVEYELFANYNIMNEIYSTVFVADNESTKILMEVICSKIPEITNMSMEYFDGLYIKPNKMILMSNSKAKKISADMIIESFGELSIIKKHFELVLFGRDIKIPVTISTHEDNCKIIFG